MKCGKRLCSAKLCEREQEAAAATVNRQYQYQSAARPAYRPRAAKASAVAQGAAGFQ